ncbi:MAG: type IV pilin [Thermoplasmatota archaeon]
MKAMKKNFMGVSPVIAVILMVAITVVLAGVVFLWAQSFIGDEDTVDTMNIKVNLYADQTGPNTADKIEVEVVSGQINWGDYEIRIGATTLTDVTTSNAGDTLTIAAGLPVLTQGETYAVKIVNVGENKVVWEKDIIAKSYAS